MAKKRDWHRLNSSKENCDIELDYNSFTVRARYKNMQWEYRKAYNAKHALSIGENICWEQSNRTKKKVVKENKPNTYSYH